MPTTVAGTEGGSHALRWLRSLRRNPALSLTLNAGWHLGRQEVQIGIDKALQKEHRWCVQGTATSSLFSLYHLLLWGPFTYITSRNDSVVLEKPSRALGQMAFCEFNGIE